MRPPDRSQLQAQAALERAHRHGADFLLRHLRSRRIRQIDRGSAAADAADEPAQLLETQRIGARARAVAGVQFFEELGAELIETRRGFGYTIRDAPA